MTARREGISVLNDGHRRMWGGVFVELWEAEGGLGSRGEYVSANPRLFVLLDQSGGEFELRLAPNEANLGKRHAPRQISFIPAGVPLWSRFTRPTYLRHLDVHFDLDMLRTRLAEDFAPEPFETPRLMFTDERLLTLAGLIAAECQNPQTLHDLYGDSLATALLVDFVRSSGRDQRRRTPLATRQLRRVVDYIEENCLRSIRLQELADLAGLSPSYFSHAFKAATGLPPHQWQTNARLRRAQELLRASALSLPDIAAATGFCDQAHLTRAFRQNLGTTPAAWRRELRS
ncbi:AraC family transcriptional regulator [Ancylobacter sp. 6x-1]|uniref:AraC family transcriptional regulator n=1 Tax=Ancylobacter crimeensis TaxID=2579147 RepID=A0ABT0D790_9HYPH|nr:AraC family transcriptional regulator [Ancylobacter crimeensis]MCK0195816.1 AraC family transcriptional regulator [Ancylobacter crimeensis]